MLNALRNHEFLGSPSFYLYFFGILNNGKYWRKRDIEAIFYNKIIDGRTSFNGCIELAIRINLLQKHDQNFFVNPVLKGKLEFTNQFKPVFISYLLDNLADDAEFIRLFDDEFMTFDIVHKSYQISNAAFGFRYANFRDLLLSFGLIECHPNSVFNSFLIAPHLQVFCKEKILLGKKGRKINVDELKQSLLLQQKNGQIAEKFVVNYEIERLQRQDIEWVAEFIVNEGYDIASYDNSSDKNYNRFIEVKSYVGAKPYFFWSKNEYFIARLKKEEYWIYLVDMDKINVKNYEPAVIQNPAETIMDSVDWSHEIEQHKFTHL